MSLKGGNQMILRNLGKKQIYIDLYSSTLGTLYAKEGERESRGLDITILNQGLGVDTTGLTITMYADVDGEVYEKKATIVDASQGKYELLYPTNMLHKGVAKAELRLRKGEANIATKTFQLDIEKAIFSSDIIEASDELSLLERLVEAARNEAERVESELIRKSNEETRMGSETTREENETVRKATESTRISKETGRVTAEGLRKTAETERDGAETLRKSAETSRVGVEQTRVTAETSRVGVEKTRVTAETARKDAESGRVSVETTRVSDEDIRKNNETARLGSESTRQDNESTRKINETSREAAESTRLSNETSRVNVEKDRVTAETLRVGAESSRRSAEASRVNIEETRVTTEVARKNAETVRVESEDSRVENEAARQQLYDLVQSSLAEGSFNGKDLEYNWRGSELGVRLKGEVSYTYVNLKGVKGDTGSIENLAASNIETALGFLPQNYKAGANITITGDMIRAQDTIVDISGKADKEYVDNKVKTDVPLNAKFTDTNTITSINGKTGVISKADIVALGIPAQDTVVNISGKADISYVDEKVKTVKIVTSATEPNNLNTGDQWHKENTRS